MASSIQKHMSRMSRGIDVRFCGLSMGALFAVRVSSLVTPPSGVTMSSVVLAGRCPPPFDKSVEVNTLLETKTGAEFNEEDVKQYNLASEQVTTSSAWRDHFLPLLLSDLATDRRLSSTRLNVPKEMEVRVCCGMSDLSYPHEKTIEWSKVGGASLSVTLMEGGHEFLNKQVGRLLDVCLARSDGGVSSSGNIGYSSNNGMVIERKKEITPLYRVVWDPLGVVDNKEESKEEE